VFAPIVLLGPRLRNGTVYSRQQQLPSTRWKNQETRLALFEGFAEGRVTQPNLDFAGADKRLQPLLRHGIANNPPHCRTCNRNI
jgi:hypothetical protein